jgi:hypothetical protein
VPVYRRAFVTSTTGTGKLGNWTEVIGLGLTSFEAGNRICQIRAEAAGLATGGDPEFMAWLSDPTDDAYCRLRGLAGRREDDCDSTPPLPVAGPWIRVDGLPWSGDLDTLTSGEPAGGPYLQMDVAENATIVALSSNFMSGTDDSGVSSIPERHCQSWISEADTDNWSGGVVSSVDSWSGGASGGCNTPRRLLCLETGFGDAAPHPKGPGSITFVTSTTCAGDLGACTAAPGDTGLDAGDNYCRESAATALLPQPDSFFAWLSTDVGPTLVSRITGPGPWRRLDGYPVAANAADWFDGRLAAVPFVDETGTEVPVGSSAWTGTTPTGSATGDDCVEWTVPTAGASGTDGWTHRSGAFWTEISIAPEPCNVPRRLYCLSNFVQLFWDNFERGDFSRWDRVVPPPVP